MSTFQYFRQPPRYTEACKAIAIRMDCDDGLVHDCFPITPDWFTKEHLDEIKQVTNDLNKAARFAENLEEAMWALSTAERQSLTNSGTITVQQIENLAFVLAGHVDGYKSWLSCRNADRSGGRDPAAHMIAEAMRRLFRKLRREITFGISPDGRMPSTDFGRLVEFALGQFCLRADWRSPAQRAYEKQCRIEGRLSQIIISCEQRRQTVHRDLSAMLSDRGVNVEWLSDERTFKLAIASRPDILPLKLAPAKFSSGSEVLEFAFNWSSSIQCGTNLMPTQISE